MKTNKIIKFICLFSVVAISFSINCVVSGSQNAMLGDVNFDGKVDAKDCIYLSKYIALVDTNINQSNADTNQNEKVSIADLLCLKKYLANIITDFNQCYIGKDPLASVNNLAAKPQDLGIPGKTIYYNETKENYYARNIWDMKSYNNKVYIGLGNYSDNTGNTPMYCYTKEDKKRINCGFLNSEAIEKFFVIDETLYTVATDPLPWLTGYFYTLNKSGKSWMTYGNLPGNIHCYDMVEFGDEIFFSGACYDNEYTTGIVQKVSKSELKTAKAGIVPFYYDDKTDLSKSYFRCYNLFVFKNNLYAIHDLEGKNNVGKYPGGLFKYENINGGRFIQIQDSTVTNGICSVIYHQNYTVGNENVVSEPWCKEIYETKEGKLVLLCNDIFITDDLVFYKKLTLGKSYENYVVRDSIKVNSNYYFCASVKNNDGTYTNGVFRTNNFESFDRVVYFDSPTFIRSFEYLNGTFFFGGGSSEKNNPQCGILYSVDLFDD